MSRIAPGLRASGSCFVAVAALLLLASPALAVNASSMVKVSGDNQTGIGGTTLPAPLVVKTLDANGNPLAGVTVKFTMSSGGGSVTPTTVTSNAQGLAQTTATLATSAGTSTITVTSKNVPNLTFTATRTAVPTKLVFSTQPANGLAGTPLASVVVTCTDNSGVTAVSFTGAVSMTIGTNPGGSTLGGTTAVNAVNGVATFTTLTLNRPGTGYRLAASATGLTGATSSTFNIAVGSAATLAFTTQPSSATAGTALTPSVVVTALDAGGNTATSFTGPITVALAANPGGAGLSGTTTVNASSGVATFSGLSLDKAGSGYTLAANATGLTGTTSGSFAISPAAAAKLAFASQPTSATAGSTLTPAVTVTAQDAYGNTVPSYTGTVTVSLAANPGGGALSGTTSVAASSGVATFANLSLARAASGYQLGAAATGLASATSATFDIDASSAIELVFGVQPASATAGVALSPSVVVVARDFYGNTATSFAGTVTVAIHDNPGGATLSGTWSVAATNGVATFADLSLNKAASGYTLDASSGPLAGATSAAFDVAPGAATALAFTMQPANAVAGATMAPILVSAVDGYGNVVTGYAGTIRVRFAAAPANAVLYGTASVAAVNGAATFSDLSIQVAYAAYHLMADAPDLPGLFTSSPFAIAPAAATTLAFLQQPSNATAGASIAPQVAVQALDTYGNLVSGFTGTVTVSLASNPGGGTLSGVTSQPASNGMALYVNLSIDKAGSGYTLAASASGLAGGTSAPFTIAPAAAATLAFTTQPSNGTAGAALAPAVVVSARDAYGNVATSFAGTVTVALGSNPGGATLSGTASVAASSGVATFADLSLERAASGYTLSANTSGLIGATSAAFAIVGGPAASLAFTTQPTSATAGTPLAPAVVVTALDAYGNTATSFGAAVTVALASNPGGGILSGTVSVTASSGVATFADLSIEKAASGYALSASASGLTGATSAAFAVAAGPAASLAFTAQPSNATAGVALSPAVVVTARDAYGNTATSFTSDVTMALGSNPGSGTLSGTKTLGASSGVATFATLSVDKAASGYTLAASAAGLVGATSDPFAITAAAPAALAFTTQPSNATSGQVIAPALAVQARDAFGNPAPSFTGSVSVALGSNPGGATLQGTTTATAASGVASFATLHIDVAASGYTLVASASGLTGATSASFDVGPGAPAQLAFVIQPGRAPVGVSIAPSIVVAVRDAFGQTVTTATNTVTLAINSTNSAQVQNASRAAVNGLATFTALTVDRVGTGYTLTAQAAGLSSSTSAAFDIGAWIAGDGLGQLRDDGAMSFTSGGANAPNRTALTPTGFALDPVQHRLFVSDNGYGRVLVFQLSANDDFQGVDRSADFVLGQPDFRSNGHQPNVLSAQSLGNPRGLAFEGSTGRLFVADPTNRRVLVFDTTQLANGMSASYVLGSSDFTSSSYTYPPTAASMGSVSSLAIDDANHHLFVMDCSDNRVLVFDTSSLSNGMNASFVIGQPDFASSMATGTYPPETAQRGFSTGNGDEGISFDSTTSRLYVADSGNRRVLVFEVATITNGMNATWVVGQPDFVTMNFNFGGLNQVTPSGLWIDPARSRLYVADNQYVRALVFDTSALANGMSASFVLGGSYGATSASNFGSCPALLVTGASDRVLLADQANYRVLSFDGANLASSMSATDGLGHLDANGAMVFTRGNWSDSATASSLSNPIGLAFDAGRHRLFVADSGNERVLVYQLSSTNSFAGVDRAADIVLLKSSFTDAAATGYGARCVLYDSVNDRLYVGAGGTIKVFNAAALGNGATPIATITGFPYASDPAGLALDAAGQRLFVAESVANRVRVFDIANLLTTGAQAVNVLGQPNMTATSSVYPPTASSLSSPTGVAYDATTNRLYVADQGNNRVLVYNTTAITNGMAAANVLGQTSFTTSTAGTSSAAGLFGPSAVTLDATRGRLIVSDRHNYRVVSFPISPLINTPSAVQVIGRAYLWEGNYSTALPSATTLQQPQGAILDPQDPTKLWIADTYSNRVLQFTVP